MPEPGWVTVPEAARRMGVCRRRLLTEYVRLGLLPYPDQQRIAWAEADIVKLEAYFEDRRRRSGLAGDPPTR